MSAIEPLPQELETLSLEQQADAIVKAAEVRVDVLNRVMTVALKRTLPRLAGCVSKTPRSRAPR